MRLVSAGIATVALAACHATAPPPPPAPATATASAADRVFGVEPAQLDPAFWVRLQAHPDQVILTPEQIARQNRTMLAEDSSLTDLERLPDTLTADVVRRWVTKLSHAPSRQLYDEKGDSVTAAQVEALVAAADLDAVPARQALRFALITRRADLRTFPTRRRVFAGRDNTDIDLWQETAFFPGTPAVIAHESRDGQWWFVIGQHYSAWVEGTHVAEGPREVVLGYVHKTPYLVVAGADAHTVFTPERPAVSDVRLEMGVRVPLLADWPASRPVNGQIPYTGRVIELPTRTVEGRLELAPALLPPTADVSTDYLPLTPGGLIRQAFKFLGEHYGWGHGYGSRDCSGYANEVYRAFGVDLPRNTGDQATSPALHRIALTDADSPERRAAVLGGTGVGDLLFIPGHEMIVIGHYGGMPWVIHDTYGPTERAPDGSLVRLPLNGVSVTPLPLLLSGSGRPFADRIYSIQQMRP